MKVVNKLVLTFMTKTQGMDPAEETNKFDFAIGAVCEFVHHHYQVWNDEPLNDIATALSEALWNCDKHAYSEDGGEVRISVFLTDIGRLCIYVKDSGCGISDIKEAMEPMFTTGNDDEHSGLGFSVMQCYMDNVSVTSSKKGTTVKMIKTFF